MSQAGTAGAQAGISDSEFRQFQALLRKIAGIHLSPQKKPLVTGRLVGRLRHYRLATFGDYFRLLVSGREPAELQTALDLLTTNETSFFRESRHFDLLRQTALSHRSAGAPFRVWSAACSSGEEPYTIAMVLADCLGESGWEVMASDISLRVLERARRAHYPLERATGIPKPLLHAHCLKGVGQQEGTFLIDRRLRERVQFCQINLNEPLPSIGTFDVVFLRNVMIYFETETKRQVVGRIAGVIRQGGHLLIGHSESLNGVTDVVQSMGPAVYRKPQH